MLGIFLPFSIKALLWNFIVILWSAHICGFLSWGIPSDHKPLFFGHVFYSQPSHVMKIINFLPSVTPVKNVICSCALSCLLNWVCKCKYWTTSVMCLSMRNPTSIQPGIFLSCTSCHLLFNIPRPICLLENTASSNFLLHAAVFCCLVISSLAKLSSCFDAFTK